MTCTDCNGNSFTFSCVNDVRASQETHIWASTACCDDSVRERTIRGQLKRATSDENVADQEREVTACACVSSLAVLSCPVLSCLH
jgi:hypothetical protein